MFSECFRYHLSFILALIFQLLFIISYIFNIANMNANLNKINIFTSPGDYSSFELKITILQNHGKKSKRRPNVIDTVD